MKHQELEHGVNLVKEDLNTNNNLKLDDTNSQSIHLEITFNEESVENSMAPMGHHIAVRRSLMSRDIRSLPRKNIKYDVVGIEDRG